MDAGLNAAVAVVVAFLMLVLGTGLTGDEFRRVGTRSGVVILGTAGQYLAMPLVGWVAVTLTRPGPSVTEALVLVAASPGGVLSNVFAALGGGNVALSLTLTTVSSVLAAAVVPLLVAAGVAALMGETVRVHVPLLPAAAQLLGLLVLPVLAGMVLRRRAPVSVARHAAIARRIAGAGVGAVLLAVVVAERASLPAVLGTGAVTALAFTALALGAGLAAAGLGRLDRPDRITLVAEFGARNTALAALLASQILGRRDVVAVIVLFFVVQTVVLLAVTAAYRTGARPSSASTT